MDVQQFIRETLKGFDYSTREKRRLAKELYEEVTKRDMSGWESIYEFVTEKLDRLNTPRQDLAATHERNGLDVVVKDEDGKQLFRRGLIGRKDPSLERVLEGPSQEPQFIPLATAIRLVKGKIPKKDYAFLRDLGERVNGSLSLPSDPDQIINSINRIRDSTRWIAQAFYDEREGLVIPGQIKVISSDPLDMRIGRLDQETVAKIYEAHERDLSYTGAADYAGVGESTVKRLWDIRNLESRHNKMEGNRRTLDAATRRKIFEAHEKKMSLYEAADYAGVSHGTIKTQWESEGLRAHLSKGKGIRGYKGTPQEPEKVAEMIRLYEVEGEGSYIIGKKFSLTPTAVIYNLKKAGVKIRSTRARLTSEEIDRIVDLTNQGKSIREIGLIGGRAPETVRRYVDQINPRTHKLPESAYTHKPNIRSALKPKQIRQILEAHRIFDGNISKAARNLPWSYQTVRNHWVKNGLEPLRLSGRRTVTEEEKEQIFEAYEAYQGRTREAAKHLPFPAVLISRYWRENGLQPRLGPAQWRPPQNGRSEARYKKVDLEYFNNDELKAAIDLKYSLEKARKTLPCYGDGRNELGRTSTEDILYELEERLLSPNERTGRMNTDKVYSFIGRLNNPGKFHQK